MIDLTGKRFGRLIVIKRMDNDKWGSHKWLCRCSCGMNKVIRGSHLRSNATRSCGCLNKETIIERLTKHGHNKKKKYLEHIKHGQV